MDIAISEKQWGCGSSVNVRTGSIISFIVSELKPRGKLLTPFNMISGFIIFVGIILIVLRFVMGLGATTNLNQEYPWGIWIGFDVVTGVAFAAGAYVVAFMVYILGMKKYDGILKATILNGFLAYLFYAGALLLDLGRPWNIINPIIGNSFGFSSALFLVAWHFMLYMIALFIEFSPVVAEWLNLSKLRKVTGMLTMGTVIFGICLSMLHQSGLGALFLLAKGKIHPLWYSEFLPMLFLVSSVYSGLCIVILEATISHKVFASQLSKEKLRGHDGIVLGLSRIATMVLFVYFFIKVMVLIHDMNWNLLGTKMGLWYCVELIGFVFIPFLMFFYGTKIKNNKLLLIAAAMSLVGVVLNRLNISVITFKWYEEVRYVPSWIELWVTAAIVLAEIWAFRWVVNRMPVLMESPKWVSSMEETL